MWKSAVDATQDPNAKIGNCTDNQQPQSGVGRTSCRRFIRAAQKRQPEKDSAVCEFINQFVFHGFISFSVVSVRYSPFVYQMFTVYLANVKMKKTGSKNAPCKWIICMLLLI